MCPFMRLKVEHRGTIAMASLLLLLMVRCYWQVVNNYELYGLAYLVSSHYVLDLVCRDLQFEAPPLVTYFSYTCTHAYFTGLYKQSFKGTTSLSRMLCGHGGIVLTKKVVDSSTHGPGHPGSHPSN